jgi:hypothetical protein
MKQGCDDEGGTCGCDEERVSKRNFWRIPESRKEGRRKEGKIRAGGDGVKGGSGQEGEKGRVGGGRGSGCAF